VHALYAAAEVSLNIPALPKLCLRQYRRFERPCCRARPQFDRVQVHDTIQRQQHIPPAEFGFALNWIGRARQGSGKLVCNPEIF